MMRILPRRDLSAQVWKLAGPVVIGMVSQTLMNVIDTAMVGRLGPVALAAAGLGGVVSWTVMGTVGSLHIGVQAVSARRFGEQRCLEAGRVLDNALLLGLVVGLAVSLAGAFGLRGSFGLFTGDPSVADQAGAYTFWRVLGSLPFMVIMAYRGFFNGIGRTTLHMKVGIVVNTVNALLNWVLIFGNLGAPAMGTAGAGLASTIGSSVGMLLFAWIAVRFPRRDEFAYHRVGNLSRDVVRRILRLASFSSGRIFLAMLGFSAFSGIVARLGTAEMAATNVILTIISMSFLPGAGLGTAAGTLLGQKLGEGRPEVAEIYGWEAVRLGVAIMGVFGAAFLAVPELLLSFFTSEEAVVRMGAPVLSLLGVVQIVDAVGMVLGGALEGAGLNRFVMLSEIAVNWGLFLPMAWLMAHAFGQGLMGAWSALVAYITVLGIVLTVKYAGGGWKSAEV